MNKFESIVKIFVPNFSNSNLNCFRFVSKTRRRSSLWRRRRRRQSDAVWQKKNLLVLFQLNCRINDQFEFFRDRFLPPANHDLLCDICIACKFCCKTQNFNRKRFSIIIYIFIFYFILSFLFFSDFFRRSNKKIYRQ